MTAIGFICGAWLVAVGVAMLVLSVLKPAPRTDGRCYACGGPIGSQRFTYAGRDLCRSCGASMGLYPDF